MMKVSIPLVVGVIAAVTAFLGYLINAAAGRRSERARRYADALNAVEKYKQLPFTFARLHDGTAESRAKLAEMLGDTQTTLSFNRRWLTSESPELGEAYDKLVDESERKIAFFGKTLCLGRRQLLMTKSKSQHPIGTTRKRKASRASP
jgi:hypothetical protein